MSYILFFERNVFSCNGQGKQDEGGKKEAGKDDLDGAKFLKRDLHKYWGKPADDARTDQNKCNTYSIFTHVLLYQLFAVGLL